jgi:hypothetical protein
MNMKSILKGLLSCFILGMISTTSFADTYDTTKVCAGQAMYVVDTATSGGTYTFQWIDASNAVIGTDDTLNVTSVMTSNATVDPIIRTYRLIVSQTGGAGCSADTFHKTVISYPQLATSLASANPFYCVGNPTNIVITATTVTSNAANAAPSAPVVYTWDPGTAPAGSASANVYTVLAASFPATPGTYTYATSVTYSQTLQGSVAGLAGCTASNTVGVIVNAAPSVNGTTVITSFQ